MKALLYYDLRRNYISTLVLFIITCLLLKYSNTLILIYYGFFVANLVIKTFPLNRSEGFEKRIYTFPIEARDIVLSKYLYFLINLLVGLIGFSIYSLINKFSISIINFRYFWIGNLITIIIVSNIFPRLFKNPERSNKPDVTISFINIISVIGIITLLLTLLLNILQKDQLNHPLLQMKYLIIFTIITIALLINSYFKSLKAIKDN